MVINWNRHDIGEGMAGDQWWYPDFPAVLNAARAHTWDDSDLFPTYGMATFGSNAGCLPAFLRFGRTRR